MSTAEWNRSAARRRRARAEFAAAFEGAALPVIKLERLRYAVLDALDGPDGIVAACHDAISDEAARAAMVRRLRGIVTVTLAEVQ